MNTFDENEYAYKIHFSKNFDCDSDSDNKSDFDDWYYKHKPPPAEIYDCDIVKIEPFTTVLYKKSITKVSSKVNVNSQNKIESNRSSAGATKNVSDLNHKTQVSSERESNKPKGEGTILTNLSGYQEYDLDKIPKKKRNRKKKNQISRANPFDLCSIEWPTLGGVQSSLKNKTGNIKKNVNSSKDTKILTELSKKCDNNVPSETKRLISESVKSFTGKSITETRFLLLDEYEKQSFFKFPENLQNALKLNNVIKNKVTCNSKENIQNISRSKGKAKELPLLGNAKESIAPSKNSKVECKKLVKTTHLKQPQPFNTILFNTIDDVKKTRKNKSKRKKSNKSKQPDHGTLRSEDFNLSSFKWPSLPNVISPSLTDINNPQQMELKKCNHTNSLRQNQSAHLFKNQINCTSILAEAHQRQQQLKKRLKSPKSKPISDYAICSITNKSSSVKDYHNKHGSLHLNEQIKENTSPSYSNTNGIGSFGLESCNGFWGLDNEEISIFTRNQSYCKSSRKQSQKEILKSQYSCLHNEELSSCSSKNIEKPKQSIESTKINIQSTAKKEGSLNLSSKTETLEQPKAPQSRSELFINTSESYHLSSPKSEKKGKPTDTCVNEKKAKKTKPQKRSGTNSSPLDKKSDSLPLDKNHNIFCKFTGCNEAEQLDVQPKENLFTDTIVNTKKKKKKKQNQISELNSNCSCQHNMSEARTKFICTCRYNSSIHLSCFDQTEVSELKQKKTENSLELNNSAHTEKLLKMHPQPKEEKANTGNAEFQHSEKQLKKGLSKCLVECNAVDKKDTGSRSHDKEYTCISKVERRSKKQANMKSPNENAKLSKKEEKDPLWPKGFLLPLFKQKTKKLANQSVRSIIPPPSSKQHTDDIIFSKNGKMVFDDGFKETLENMGLDSVIPLNTFVTGGKDFFFIDKLFVRSPFLICAKPRLGMCNVLLHFYTGYTNDKENIFDSIMPVDDLLIDTLLI